MKIHDISVPIHNDMPVWPGDLKVNVRRFSKIEDGESANVTAIVCSVHTGTHIDAPIHYVKSGYGIEQIDLNLLVGEVEVLEVNDNHSHINRDLLENIGKQNWLRRLILKTSNSRRNLLKADHFSEDFVALTTDGAAFLLENGVELVGVDYLSVAPFDNGVPTHKLLLQSNVVLLEGLNLSEVNPGIYELVALPILIQGSDGAPARVILIER